MKKNKPNAGVDIEKGGVANMLDHGVFDLLATRKEALKLATDAVITILRVDQIIMAKPAGGPKLNNKQAHWDED